MRLRSTLILVLIIAGVVTVGAWTDRTNVAVAEGPTAVPATEPWETIVEISRRGRRLDGFRPVLTIEGLGDPKSFTGNQLPSGKYRVQVVFPHPGFYTYTVKVADRIATRGTVYAIPR
jgi:hypothetical protein